MPEVTIEVIKTEANAIVAALQNMLAEAEGRYVGRLVLDAPLGQVQDPASDEHAEVRDRAGALHEDEAGV